MRLKGFKNALELLPFLEEKFTSLGNIQTSSKSDASGVKPQVTRDIEPKPGGTEEATQGNRPSLNRHQK
jgi:hypothetical protein